MPSLDLLINHGSEEEATRDPRPSPSCKSCKCEIRASDFLPAAASQQVNKSLLSSFFFSAFVKKELKEQN